MITDFFVCLHLFCCWTKLAMPALRASVWRNLVLPHRSFGGPSCTRKGQEFLTAKHKSHIAPSVPPRVLFCWPYVVLNLNASSSGCVPAWPQSAAVSL